MIITQVISALQAGQELENSANWKNKQMMVGAISSVLGVGVTVVGYFGVHLGLSNEDVIAISGGVAVILGLFNTTITAATSKKVGLPSGSAVNEVSPEHTDNG